MRKYFLILLFLGIGTSFLFPSCRKLELEKNDVPACIKKKIRRGQSGKQIVAVVEWELPTGEKLYLFVPSCCDGFDYLYDSDCKKICAPSGGFSGHGDGQCPVDYFKMDIKKTLVWKEKR